MKHLAIKDLKAPKYLRERLGEDQYLLVTNNGKPMALMMDIPDGQDPEELLTAVREARARMAVSRMRASAKSAGASRLALDEINKEIATTRAGRRAAR